MPGAQRNEINYQANSVTSVDLNTASNEQFRAELQMARFIASSSKIDLALQGSAGLLQEIERLRAALSQEVQNIERLQRALGDTRAQHINERELAEQEITVRFNSETAVLAAELAREEEAFAQSVQSIDTLHDKIQKLDVQLAQQRIETDVYKNQLTELEALEKYFKNTEAEYPHLVGRCFDVFQRTAQVANLQSDYLDRIRALRDKLIEDLKSKLKKQQEAQGRMAELIERYDSRVGKGNTALEQVNQYLSTLGKVAEREAQDQILEDLAGIFHALENALTVAREGNTQERSAIEAMLGDAARSVYDFIPIESYRRFCETRDALVNANVQQKDNLLARINNEIVEHLRVHAQRELLPAPTDGWYLFWKNQRENLAASEVNGPRQRYNKALEALQSEREQSLQAVNAHYQQQIQQHNQAIATDTTELTEKIEQLQALATHQAAQWNGVVEILRENNMDDLKQLACDNEQGIQRIIDEAAQALDGLRGVEYHNLENCIDKLEELKESLRNSLGALRTAKTERQTELEAILNEKRTALETQQADYERRVQENINTALSQYPEESRQAIVLRITELSTVAGALLYGKIISNLKICHVDLMNREDGSGEQITPEVIAWFVHGLAKNKVKLAGLSFSNVTLPRDVFNYLFAQIRPEGMVIDGLTLQYYALTTESDTQVVLPSDLDIISQQNAVQACLSSNNCSLRELNFRDMRNIASSAEIGNQVAEQLATGLSTNTSLVRMCFKFNRLDESAMALVLKGFNENSSSNIRFFNFHHNKVRRNKNKEIVLSEQVCKALVGNRLDTLVLSWMGLSYATLNSIKKVMEAASRDNNPVNISELHLHGNLCNERDYLDWVSAEADIFLHAPNLSMLQLQLWSNNAFPVNKLKEIAKSKRKINTVYISSGGREKALLGADFLLALFGLLQANEVKSLKMDGVKLDDTELQKLFPDKSTLKVRERWQRHTLSQINPILSLHTLMIRNSTGTADAWLYLARKLKNYARNLCSLWFYNNQMGEATLERRFLTHLAAISSLQHVDLHGNSATIRSALDFLVAFKDHPNVTSITLHNIGQSNGKFQYDEKVGLQLLQLFKNSKSARVIANMLIRPEDNEEILRVSNGVVKLDQNEICIAQALASTANYAPGRMARLLKRPNPCVTLEKSTLSVNLKALPSGTVVSSKQLQRHNKRFVGKQCERLDFSSLHVDNWNILLDYVTIIISASGFASSITCVNFKNANFDAPGQFATTLSLDMLSELLRPLTKLNALTLEGTGFLKIYDKSSAEAKNKFFNIIRRGIELDIALNKPMADTVESGTMRPSTEAYHAVVAPDGHETTHENDTGAGVFANASPLNTGGMHGY